MKAREKIFLILGGILFVISSFVLIGRSIDWMFWNLLGIDLHPHYLSSLIRTAFVPSVICFVLLIFIGSAYFFQSTFGRSYR